MSHLDYVLLAYSVTAIFLIGITSWLIIAKIRLKKQMQFLKKQLSELSTQNNSRDISS